MRGTHPRGPRDRKTRDRLAALVRGRLEGPVRTRLRGGWTESWADDVIQNTLVAVLRSLGRCRAESEEQAWAWVHQISRRETARLFRREGPRVLSAVPLHDHLEAPTCQDPELHSSSPFAAPLAELRLAVAELDADQQRLLRLRFVAGATWREVGSALGGISGAAAKRRGQRLFGRLRSRLVRFFPTQ